MPTFAVAADAEQPRLTFCCFIIIVILSMARHCLLMATEWVLYANRERYFANKTNMQQNSCVIITFIYLLTCAGVRFNPLT